MSNNLCIPILTTAGIVYVASTAISSSFPGLISTGVGVTVVLGSLGLFLCNNCLNNNNTKERN